MKMISSFLCRSWQSSTACRSSNGLGRLLFTMAAAVIVGHQAQGVEIRFRSECSPQGNIVRLGDLAEVISNRAEEATELKSVELFPAPAAGDRLVLPARDICDRLSLRGVKLAPHSISGASKVTIYNSLQPATKSKGGPPPSDNLREQAQLRVRAAIVEHLQQYTEATAAWQVDFELTEEQVRLVCRASAKPAVQGGNQPWTGEQQFQIAISTADSLHHFAVSATVAAAGPVVVVRRAISRGAVLNRADVELKTPVTPEAAEGAFVRLEEAIGRETVRALGEGESVGADDVQAPILVHKRDIVTVYARSPGIRVRVTGRAVDDGALGDVIAVESIDDRKTFFARVSGAQEAEVYARAGQAATAAASRAEAMSEN